MSLDANPADRRNAAQCPPNMGQDRRNLDKVSLQNLHSTRYVVILVAVDADQSNRYVLDRTFLLSAAGENSC